MSTIENEASRRMHDYLLNKQRRKEEYWIRKYGRVLVPAPEPLAHHQQAHAAVPSPPRPGEQLPPLAHRPSPTAIATNAGGVAAMFSAAGPISSFPAKGAPLPNPDRRHRAARGAAAMGGGGGPVQYHPALQLPPLQHPPTLPPQHEFSEDASAGVPLGQKHSHQHLEEEEDDERTRSHYSPPDQDAPVAYTPPLPAYVASPSVEAQFHSHALDSTGALTAFKDPNAHSAFPVALLPPLEAKGRSVTQQQSPVRVGGVGGGVLGHPREVQQRAAVRDLQMELAVLKAIKGREDCLDRLRVACEKLDGSFGGISPMVLSQADPLVRLFYRLVGTLRQRTLEAVEAIAAWHRKTGSTEAFMYYGTDYLASVGEDLKFLDQVRFLSARLSLQRAVDDPFLLAVTPDGIPVEEATTCDLRRGGMRFSSEALRIRMARKVLATYGGHQRGGFMEEESSAMAAAGAADPNRDIFGESGDDDDDDDTLGGEGELLSFALQPPDVLLMQQQQQHRQQSPQQPELEPQHPQHPQPFGEEEKEEEVSAEEISGNATTLYRQEGEDERETAQEEEDVQWEEEGEDEEAPPEGEAGAEMEVEAEMEAEAEAEVAERLFQTNEEAHTALMRSLVSEAEDMLDIDDDHFLEYCVEAMVTSLEPHHAALIKPGTFTMAGWDIDRQLDHLILGLEENVGEEEEAERGGQTLPEVFPAEEAAASTSEFVTGRAVGETSTDLIAVLDDLIDELVVVETVTGSSPLATDGGPSSASSREAVRTAHDESLIEETVSSGGGGPQKEDSWGSASGEGATAAAAASWDKGHTLGDSLAIDDIVDDLIGGIDQ